MARPDCPRCGSDLVVAALPDNPSEWVEELRGGNVRARPIAGRRINWLCRVCGLRWDQQLDPDDVRAEPEDDAERREHPSSIVREHAPLLQLQPERMARSSTGRATGGPMPVLKRPPDARGRRGLVGWAMGVIAVAAVVFIALLPPRSRTDVEIPGRDDAPVAVQGSGPATPSPPAPPERQGLRAALDVRQPCWVQVIADGEIIDSITFAPGDKAVYRADRDLQLRLGNAGGVRLRVNGERVATGSPGEVVVLDLSWRRGDVRIERA